MKFCTECGNQLNDSEKFCSQCGHKVETEVEASVEALDHLSSEEYIQKVLYDSHESGVEISPFKNEKKLINAAKSIGKGVNPATIIGLIDTSMFSNGKTGAVFTGTHLYMKESFLDSHVVPFEGMTHVDYKLNRTTTENHKIKEEKILTISYQDQEDIVVTSDDLNLNFPFALIYDILNGLKEKSVKIESMNQIFHLENLGSTIISLYFRVIIAFLKQEDNTITTNEYKELLTLMTKVKVSKDVADVLREYRFSDQAEDLDEVIAQLKEELEKSNVSSAIVFQSLCMDIIAMDIDNLDKWKTSTTVKQIIQKLNVSEELIEFKVKEIEQTNRIYNEKLTNSAVKEMATELSALAAGAGVSVGAIAITGAVTGWGASVSGGLLAITFGSGGALLGVTAIAAGGYGAYRGVKYITGTDQLENYSMKHELLTERIKSLKAANTFVLDDFNFLMNSINQLSLKIIEQQELSKSIVSTSGALIEEKNQYIDELLLQLQEFTKRGQSVVESGQIIEDEQVRMEIERLLTMLPEKLDIPKLNELIQSEVNREEYLAVIETAYHDDGEGNFILDESLGVRELEMVYDVLTNIKYFEIGASSYAQGKAYMKKGVKSLRAMFQEE